MIEPFGAAHGLAIAAAVTRYDGKPEEITDPTIGELKFYAKQWGNGLFTNNIFEELK